MWGKNGAGGVLFAVAHVKQSHVIELPLGEEATLFGDDCNCKNLMCDA